MHLRHEDVRIVPRVTDDCRSLSVSLDVIRITGQQELRGVIAPEQKRLADRTISVQALEVQLRGPCVGQGRRVYVMADRRPIGGDVVGNELAEERPPGGFAAERAVVVFFSPAVAQSSGAAEREQEGLVSREGRQLGEHPRIPRRRKRRVDRPPYASRSKAVCGPQGGSSRLG